MVLLKLMEEEFMCWLLMGTLWCEKRGLGWLVEGRGTWWI